MEHFIAASMSLVQTRSFDAVCIIVSGAIAAISDALMRKIAIDQPSVMCSHLIGKTASGRQLGLSGNNHSITSHHIILSYHIILSCHIIISFYIKSNLTSLYHVFSFIPTLYFTPKSLYRICLTGFGIGVSTFATQSETLELHTPELAITRTAVLDYFHSPAQTRLGKTWY